MAIKLKGINYDTGTTTVTGSTTRETFDLRMVAAEMDIIKNELHCNAIRISGLDIERIANAAEIALQLGLTVWFSPSLHYGNREDALNYIMKAAATAEKLRLKYTAIVFVTGCEMSLFTSGFVKGETGDERLKTLFGPVSMLKNIIGIKRKYNKLLNQFLSTAVSEIKKQFHGQITYASGSWEKVDWDVFDFIGVDLYRASYNKPVYRKEIQRYKKMGKPFCITEFGCCAYKGADDKGAMGWAIVDWTKKTPGLKGHYTRDEEVQSKYLLELLDIFESENVFGTFAFTFISYNYIYNSNAARDLDMASYGIVKSLGAGALGYKNLPWLPKQAFFDFGRYNESIASNI